MLGFGFAAFLLFFSTLSDPRRRFLAPDRVPKPVPASARYESKTELAWAALFPSTVGVSALAAVALTFNRTLGVLLAGVVAGLGLAAVVGGLRLADLERRSGIRLYAERGGKELYAEPTGAPGHYP